MPQGILRYISVGRFALLEEHFSLWIVALHTYRGKTKCTSPTTEPSQLQAAPCFRHPLLFAPLLILIYLLKESMWQQILQENLLRLKALPSLIVLHYNPESILKTLVLNLTSMWTLSAATFYLKYLMRESSFSPYNQRAEWHPREDDIKVDPFLDKVVCTSLVFPCGTLLEDGSFISLAGWSTGVSTSIHLIYEEASAKFVCQESLTLPIAQ